MIYGISGRPGGGKSYEAVAFHVLPALESGRKVITNLPLQIDMFVKVFGPEVIDLIVVIDGKLNDFGSTERPFSKHTDYIDDWKNEKGQGPLYLIDECHMVLPARGLDAEILEFYSLHRHYGIDIVLITQHLRKIHRDIRDMIEINYVCQKNTALGSENSYTKKVKQGASGDVVNTSIRKYKKTYFTFYKSHTASNSAVQEAYAQDITPLWKRWPVIGAGICFVLSAIILSTAFMNKKDNSKPPSVRTPPTQQHVVNPVNVVRTNQPIETKIEKEKEPTHPLSKFTFYVAGQAKQFVRASYEGDNVPDQSLNFYRIYIDVYENNKKLFTVEHNDLVNFGYEFKRIAECFYELSYGDFSEIVTCGEISVPKDGIEAIGANLF